MEIKDVLVFLEAGAPCEARVALAARIAEEAGAAITGWCACSEPRLDLADAYVIGPAAVGQALAHRQAAITAAMAPVEAAFRRATAARGDAHWLAAPANTSPRELALKARYADLAVLRRPEPGDNAGRELAELSALASGCPCLFVPEPSTPPAAFRRIVVAWKDSAEAKRALDDAMPFLKAAEDAQVVVVDGEEAEAVAGAEAVLARLARHGVRARPQRFHARQEDAGAALLRACVAFDADLLVMGAYGHSRAAELVLGGATDTVLGKAPLPVLMSH